MDVEEMIVAANIAGHHAVEEAEAGERLGVMLQSLMTVGWLMTAEICARLDKLIEMKGEGGDG